MRHRHLARRMRPPHKLSRTSIEVGKLLIRLRQSPESSICQEVNELSSFTTTILVQKNARRRRDGEWSLWLSAASDGRHVIAARLMTTLPRRSRPATSLAAAAGKPAVERIAVRRLPRDTVVSNQSLKARLGSGAARPRVLRLLVEKRSSTRVLRYTADVVSDNFLCGIQS